MEPKEVEVMCLKAEYRVFRNELLVFTNWVIAACLISTGAAIMTHVFHNLAFGRYLATAALLLGLMAIGQMVEKMQVIKDIADRLNAHILPEGASNQGVPAFQYDYGKRTSLARQLIELPGKIIAVVLLVYACIP